MSRCLFVKGGPYHVWSLILAKGNLNQRICPTHLRTKSFVTQAVKRRYKLHDAATRFRYHKGLQTYYAKQPLDQLTSRLLFEYPRHLVIAGDYATMREFLSSLQVFSALYTPRDKYDFLRYWNAVGAEKERAGELYRQALKGSLDAFNLAQVSMTDYSHSRVSTIREIKRRAIIVAEASGCVLARNE